MGRSDTDNSSSTVLPTIFLCAIVLACLFPFVKKAFNMDDPLFLWAARHIQIRPLDFYGFKVNWFGWETPMVEAQKNPPLVSYYIALVAKWFGWTETALHIAFFIPAAAAAAGAYYIARELCSRPFTAVLAGIFSPVFIISSTTVMCDVMMAAWWVWAVFLWMRGVKKSSVLNIISACFFIVLSSLSKYFGISLIPLLLGYSLAKRDARKWAVFLLIPIALLAGYNWLTYAMYGKGLLFDAFSYSASSGAFRAGLLNILMAMAYTGGCLVSVFFYLPFLFDKRVLIAGALAVALVTGLAPVHVMFSSLPRLPETRHDIGDFYWLYALQLYIFVLSGAAILALAVSDLLRSRDAESLLLFLWVTGTFIFAAFVNWTISGRSVLPMFPVMGILLMRRIRYGGAVKEADRRWMVLVPLIPSLLIALSAAWADYAWANTERGEAVKLGQLYSGNKNFVWFAGHWGFQYYMQDFGFKPLDLKQIRLSVGDIVIIPVNNDDNGLFNMKLRDELARSSQISELRIPSSVWLATMSRYIGAGFYDAGFPADQLPFALGPVPRERYFILRLLRPLRAG